ncbi:MAG: sugar transferase [Planctomycetota bacterium]
MNAETPSLVHPDAPPALSPPSVPGDPASPVDHGRDHHAPASPQNHANHANGHAPDADLHTVWGLCPVSLHDRFWAARGVQVVRLGEPAELAPDAELYLLTDANCLALFRMAKLVDTMAWLKPAVLFVRLHNTHDAGYHETVITDDDDRFVRFERVYGTADWRLGRVALTANRDIAHAWQYATNPRDGWRDLRRSVPIHQRSTLSTDGDVFDRHNDHAVDDFVRTLVQVWQRPDATIPRAKKLEPEIWRDADTHGRTGTRFVGPVWIGAGRDLRAVDSVVGPAVLWDAPDARPAADSIQWHAIEPSPAEPLNVPDSIKPRKLSSVQRFTKRLFDIAFASVALLLTLPVYPLILLAIWLEDGRPFFFAHKRESMGGVEFPCLKFRTMKKNAEEIKQKLMEENQADGPQFFIDNDPRISNVGRILRKLNLDEFPQFVNVLLGQMSIVGPRPSPYKENQYCPPWREARLSVRPGITGLWQVKRSRDHGKDFQEWIRYDIEYVENLSWKMDLYILWRTFLMFAGVKYKPKDEA